MCLVVSFGRLAGQFSRVTLFDKCRRLAALMATISSMILSASVNPLQQALNSILKLQIPTQYHSFSSSITFPLKKYALIRLKVLTYSLLL